MRWPLACGLIPQMWPHMAPAAIIRPVVLRRPGGSCRKTPALTAPVVHLRSTPWVRTQGWAPELGPRCSLPCKKGTRPSAVRRRGSRIFRSSVPYRRTARFIWRHERSFIRGPMARLWREFRPGCLQCARSHIRDPYSLSRRHDCESGSNKAREHLRREAMRDQHRFGAADLSRI